MESRNPATSRLCCLNVVRSGRPEQSFDAIRRSDGVRESQCSPVWKTGTISAMAAMILPGSSGLNVVRSGRPEQFEKLLAAQDNASCLNVVRSGRPEQSARVARPPAATKASQCSPVWKTGTMRPHPQPGSHHPGSLNVVRSGRPEQ